MQYEELSRRHPRSLQNYENKSIQEFFQDFNLLVQMPPCVVVAGTNGKGSVCRIIEEIYLCQGYKVGSFITPHLIDFKERIRLGGRSISSRYFSAVYQECDGLFREFEKRYDRPMTFFEMMILISVKVFYRCDFAIIEVGLGGARDATRVFNPELNLFTSISLDHCHILGNTIEEIQREKLGILKPGAKVLTTLAQQMSLGGSNEFSVEIRPLESTTYLQRFFLSCPLGCGHLSTGLLGDYQLQNIQLSVRAIMHLRSQFDVSWESLILALKQVDHSCRLDWIHPRILIDGSHNEEGWSKLKDYLFQMNLLQNTQWAVCLKKTKSISKLRELTSGIPICFNPYSKSFHTAGNLASNLNGKACSSFIEVFDEWLQDENRILVVTGSLAGSARLKRSFLKLLDTIEKNSSSKYSARIRMG